MSLTLTSPAFQHENAIPSKYTCEGADASPPLAWTGAPPRTATFALIVDDPDAPDPKAPKMTYVHWVVWDLPRGVTSLEENAWRTLPAGARNGRNDWHRSGWGGPCPPIGRHRYYFKLYALDAALGDLGGGTKADLEHAMQGHVLASAVLMGTYQKGG